MINSNNQKRIAYTLIRFAIGWHFIYEGVAKLLTPDWSSAGFLINSTGPFSGFYNYLTSSDTLLRVVDLLNIYGLIIIGLGLFVGIWVRYASIAGVALLTLYYFAYPPFGVSSLGNPEGHLYIVNRIFIEAIVLTYFIVSKSSGYGVDQLLSALSKNDPDGDGSSGKTKIPSRREVLKNLASIPLLGFLGTGAFIQAKKYDLDVLSGATIQLASSSLKELKGELPKGKIGNHEISRLVLGGNLIGGWMHSRDLKYVSSLSKAYNTEKKVFETLMLAEKAGINCINIGFASNALMAKYKKNFGSKIKVISQIGPDWETGELFTQIEQAIDYGADVLQVQGNWCDWLVRDNRMDDIVKMMDRIRSEGYTAGLASHTIDALISCTDYGIIPDYYMKTMHHDRYWSAHPLENRVSFEVDGEKSSDHNKFHDNIFCLFPDRTIEFVQNAKVPVMGYKVLAAGSIPPEDGFRWAFEKGADFICVGMFDFQIVNNVNLTLDILNDLPGRSRKWFG